tara:strand:+ start:86 stop:319 length:234 start_codon:yes stop_codon:yes gene_type:complete
MRKTIGDLRKEYETETGKSLPKWDAEEYSQIKKSETYPQNNRAEPAIFDETKSTVEDIENRISETLHTRKNIYNKRA